VKLIWQHNFSDVNEIQYILPGGATHTLALPEGKPTFDGVTTTTDNAVNLFMHTIQFEIQDSITKDMSYGDATFKILITKKDGSGAILEFAAINERYYAAIVNGNPARYYVNVSQVNALQEAVETLANGGVVPSIF